MNTEQPKKSPFLYFAPGVLVFQESGHTLTTDKGYYVCSQKQKGLCKLHPHGFRVRNLERAFGRFSKKFEVPAGEREILLVKKVLGKIMHDQVEDWIECDAFNEIFDESSKMMAEDIKKGDMKEFSKNAETAIEALEDETNTNTEYVGGILTGTVMAFASKKISESDAGRTLSWLSEKIYLSDRGRILKVKFYLVGDFIFQFIRENIVDYQKPFKYIVDPRKFESLSYRDIAKKIRRGEIQETLIPPLHFGRAMVKMTNNIFNNVFRRDPKKIMDTLNYLENSVYGYTGRHLAKTFRNPRQRK